MNINKHLLNDIKSLNPQETVANVLELMEELKYSHLPVTEDKVLTGLVSEDFLLEIEDDQDTIADHQRNVPDYHIHEGGEIFQAIGICGRHNLSILPVVDDESRYIGYISPLELLQDLGRQLTFAEAGSVIVLKINVMDYHISQISQIVESEDGRIMGMMLYSNSKDELCVVLKINQTDISRIIKAFERFDYVVEEVFHQAMFSNTSSDRYDSLMNYLNI